jgi:hypothetical protein
MGQKKGHMPGFFRAEAVLSIKIAIYISSWLAEFQ